MGLGDISEGINTIVGEGVAWAGDKAADGLEKIGADGAAGAVRDGSEWAADELGAQVGERRLGETDDPKELVHGDAGALKERAAHLKDFSAAFDRLGTGMRGMDAGSWKGEAGDAFRARFEVQPKFWIRAADACETADKALSTYAETVTWAQGQAKEAVAAFAKAVQASEQAVAAHNAKVDTWNSDNAAGRDPGPKPGPFHDPGEEGLKHARHLLKEARKQRNEAAEDARQALSTALEHAPAEPSVGTELTATFKDGWERGNLVGTHLLGGLANGAAGAYRLVRRFNVLDPYNLTHPGEYVRNLNMTLAGLSSTAAHPERIPAMVLNKDWSDPGDAIGRLAVDFVGTKGAGGIAKAGLKAGAKSGARQGLKGSLRDAGRSFNCKVLKKEPVDMATGRMVLPATDVSLPGAFPFLFTRTFESAYRFGGFFGGAWASTVDERLEVDAEGVIHLTADGSARSYPHPAPGSPVVPAEGTAWPLDREADGSYTVTDPEAGVVRTFAAPADTEPGGDGTARIASVSDRGGAWISFEWDEATDTPLSLQHSGGYELKLTCQAGRVAALYLAGGAADGSDQLLKRYGYDDSGHLTAVADSAGRATRFGVDDDGRITSWTDSNDSSFSFTYDEKHRCVFHVGEAGHLRTAFEYELPSESPGHHLTRITDSLGHVSTYLVNSRLQVVAATDETGATTHTEYDDQDRPLVVTDPLGHITRYTYDESGRPLTITRPDDAVISVDYDDLGLPTRITEADGTQRHYAYDDRGNRTRATDPTGASTHYAYDARGHLASVTNALGYTASVHCNAAGLPLQITDPLGGTTAYVRDTFGRPVTVTDPLGAVTQLTWSVEGKLTRRIAPDGATETWTHDGEGNCLAHTDAGGGTSRYEYTHLDLVTAQTGPDGVRHTFAYDTELRLLQVTNPQGLTWRYAYDAAGRLLSETDFDDRTVHYERDTAGQLTFRANPLGQTITFTRDVLGRVTTKNVHGDATDYVYDPAGRLLSATGPDAEVVYQRDRLGRVKTEMVDGRVLAHDYDALGRRTRRVTPSGSVTTYAYDAAGNRTTVNVNGHALDFAHDAAGRETERRLDDALTYTQVWDPAGRLSAQTISGPADQALQQRSYTYRSDGHLVGLDDRLSGNRTFDLDAAGRVTAVHAQGWTETYAYDAAGNQTRASWPDDHAGAAARGPRTYTGTRVTSAGRIRYEHDDAGRLSLRQKTRLSRKPDTWRYEWNGEDRLAGAVTPDGTRWRYLYDPMGRRTSKQRLSADGQSVIEEVRFTWDGPTLIEQTTTSPGLPRPVTLTWDHNGLQPLAQTERITDETTQADIDQRFFAIVTDLVGTPTELVDETGSLAWHTRTTLWGTTTWAANSTAYTPLRFPGQYFDPETGLHYNYFRYYDPETARYTSPDPLGLEPAPNPAAYVRNPHSQIDRLGLKPEGCSLSDLPSLSVNEKQFGKKWGKHAQDYDLDPGNTEDRKWFREKMDQVRNSPDDVRQGPWNPQRGGGDDYIFFQKEGDLIVAKPDGSFVTMFPQDEPNKWYKGAETIYEKK